MKFRFAPQPDEERTVPMMLQNATVRVKSELFTAGTEEHVVRLGTTPDNLARSVPHAENLRNSFMRDQQLGQNIDNQILSCVSSGFVAGCLWPGRPCTSPGSGADSKCPGSNQPSLWKKSRQILAPASTIVAIRFGDRGPSIVLILEPGPVRRDRVVLIPGLIPETSSSYRTHEEVPWRYRI